MADVNLDMDVRAAADERGEPRGLLSRLLSPWTGVILGVLCYLPMLPNAFVRDDVRLIQLNPRVQNVSDMRGIWLTDWWATALAGDERGLDPNRDRLYRPLTLFTFAVEAAVHGIQPLGFRIINIGLHATVCGLVFVLARRLLDDCAIATVASVLFAIHPIHAEVLGEIVGRAELLSALFLLLGLVALVPPARSAAHGRPLVAAVAFLLALLSKETAICYPVVAGLVVWARSRAAPRFMRPSQKLVIAAILLTPLILYMPLRYFALEGQFIRPAVISSVVNPLKDASGWARIHGPFTLLGQYATLMIVPLRLSGDYGLAVFNPSAGPNVTTLVGVIVAAGLLTAAARWLWEMIRAPARRVAAGTIVRPIGLLSAMFLGSYVLISNTGLLIGTSMGERLFYWPSVPLLIVVAIGAVEFWRSRMARGELSIGSALLGAAAALILLLLAGRTAARGLDWRDNLTLFRADQSTYPQSVMSSVGLAKELTRVAAESKNRLDRDRYLMEADAALVEATKIHAGYGAAIQQRGLVCELRGERQKAAELFQLALQIDPNDGVSRAGLARLMGGSADRQARLGAAAKRVEASPDDVAARLELGGLLLMAGKASEAVEHYAVAVRLAPDQIDAVRGYSQALLLAGRRSEALPVLRKAIELDGQDWRSHTNLVGPLLSSDPKAALEHAEKAVAIEPNDLNAQLNLAEALAANGKSAESVELLRRVLAALPSGDVNRPMIEGRIQKFEGR
jgi:tetratricopeptide (TPR) repeat protein